MSQLDRGKALIRIFRKWQTIAALASVVALAGIGAAFYINGSHRPTTRVKSFNLTGTLLSSYSRTTESTAKITYTQTGPVHVTGTGVYDFTDNEGQIDFATLVNGQSVKSTLIIDGNVEYESVPQMPGKWLRVSSPNGNNFSPMSPFAFLNRAPALTILKRFASNGVTEQRSAFAGVAATEYFGHVGMPEVVTSASLPSVTLPVNIKVLVDSASMTREIQTEVNLPSHSSAHGVAPQVSTLEFSDFGTPVNVSAPAPRDVTTQIPHYLGPPPKVPPSVRQES